MCLINVPYYIGIKIICPFTLGVTCHVLEEQHMVIFKLTVLVKMKHYLWLKLIRYLLYKKSLRQKAYTTQFYQIRD